MYVCESVSEVLVFSGKLYVGFRKSQTQKGYNKLSNVVFLAYTI